MINSTNKQNNTMNTNEDIRKKEKKLSRDHWMCRIQKYTFGIDAPTYYMGYCPFFWMTWVALLVLPIVYLAKTGVKIIRAVLTPPLNYLDRVSTSRYEAKKELLANIPLEPSWRTLLDVYCYFGGSNTLEGVFGEDKQKISIKNCYSRLFSPNNEKGERIRLWFINNPDWRNTHLEAARKSLKDSAEAIKREGELESQRLRKRRERARKLSSMASLCGRGLFKLLIPTLIVAAAAGGYYGLAKLFQIVSLEEVVCAISILFGVGAAIFSIPVLVDFISTFVATDRVSTFLNKFCNALFGEKGFIARVFNAIRGVFTFAKDTVALTYKAECPLILWGDETGNITRRENTRDSNQESV